MVFISYFSASVLGTLPAASRLQAELIEVVAAAAVALAQVVTPAVGGSDFLKFKASALTGAGGVGPGGV